MASSRAPVVLSPVGTAPDRIAAAVALLDASLGEGLYSEGGFVEMDTYDAALGLAAWHGDRLVAVSVTQVLEPDDNDYYAIFGSRARRRLGKLRVASLEALAVVPEHRGRGIGQALAKAALDWAFVQGGEVAVAISWLGERDHPSWPLFERMGFERYGDSDEIYTRDSVENGWSCPVCGHPCRCTGRLYVHALPLFRF
jgi:GNAT superfamily N-acetyltransferase